MEYLFRNSATEAEKRIVLQVSALELFYDGAKYTVSYDNIISVWLNKPGGLFRPGEYSCTLNNDDRKPIYISSINYDSNGTAIEQPNSYNSFIRVLHHHLQTKSKAKFRFGVKPEQYLLRLVIIIGIFAGFIFSYSFFEIDQYILFIPAFLALFVAIRGVKFCLSNYPKYYTPDSIPLNLLPQPVTS